MRRVTILLFGPLMLAVVTGCGGGAAVTAPSRSVSTTPPAPSTVASPGNPRALARQAYLGMWQAFVTASMTADYQSPALARYAAGGALSLLTHGLYQNYRSGIVTRGQPSFRPEVTITSSGGSATQANVTDCGNDSRWGDYYKTGKPAPGQPQGKHQIYARLQPFDGTWKVTYLLVEKAGTC